MRLVNSRRKVILVTLSAVMLILLIFFAGRYVLLSSIRSALYKRLDTLKEQGIAIRFESVDVNPWSGDIQVHNLTIDLGDTLRQKIIKASVPYLLVKGIEIIPYITDRNISIRSVALTQPSFTVRPDAELPGTGARKSFFENLYIQQISITASALHLKDTLGQDTISSVYADLHIDNLGLEKMGDSLAWRDSEVHVNNFSFNMPRELYSFSVKDVRLDLNNRTFEIDSLKIVPMGSRKAFMKKYGREIDHIQGVVPFIRIKGLTLRADPRLSIGADLMTMKLHLEIYRDKRLPFKKDFYTKLPSHFLQKLPLHLHADTIRLTDSFISYEEFPEKGDSAGGIFFDKLNATITGLDNEPALTQQTILHADAKFMGSGDLRAEFTFPGDTTKPYRAAGSLRNLPMTKLNSMLGPAAKVRVESGTMKNLKFNFVYNPVRADGAVELNYENLKISSLRENNKNIAAVDLIKTLLLNTFILKKDMDEDTKTADKTGTVLFYRDRKRSIFNYWWKSLFSGIKSAYKLDKLEAALQKKDKGDKGDKKKVSGHVKKRDQSGRKKV
jgi:hypothetical protein